MKAHLLCSKLTLKNGIRPPPRRSWRRLHPREIKRVLRVGPAVPAGRNLGRHSRPYDAGIASPGRWGQEGAGNDGNEREFAPGGRGGGFGAFGLVIPARRGDAASELA